MFNADFFPTPQHVIEQMLMGHKIEGTIFWEPEAGKCDIVDYLQAHGAKEVIACELDPHLRKIVATKCRVIAFDMLSVTSDMISHVQHIVMNPPFSADEKHINHVFNIAPAGCKITALCNYSTYKNQYSKGRKELGKIIDENGSIENLEDVFSTSERSTNVEIGLIQIVKPGESYETEFEGFFMEEDPEEEQANGIMSYNVIRDMVNRYIECVKIFDQQMITAVKLRELTGEFMDGNMQNLSIAVTNNSVPVMRNQFKKALQKDCWLYIFDKMNMKKHATQQLKEDINKFVEQQEKIPFTMRNVYKMLEIVVGTTSSRMDKAIEVVFDKLTKHYDENRWGVEGWKTNSHYLINRKFIIDRMCYQDPRWYKGESKIQLDYGSSFELIEDMVKAICYITGDNYDNFCDLKTRIRYKYRVFLNGKYADCFDTESALEAARKAAYEQGKEFRFEMGEPIYGELFDWTYFTVRTYKKGTMHFEFKDKEVWGKFNQRVAKIKGYPLFEATAKQKAENKKANTSAAPKANFKKPTVLATFKVA